MEKRTRYVMVAGAALMMALAACLCAPDTDAVFDQIIEDLEEESGTTFEDSGGGFTEDGEWGDGLNTTQTNTISVGDSQTVTLDGFFDAHNWELTLNSGDSVVVRADAIGDSDPRMKVYAPNGELLDENDDTNGLGAEISIISGGGGTYTIRIDMLTTGDYTISVQ